MQPLDLAEDREMAWLLFFKYRQPERWYLLPVSVMYTVVPWVSDEADAEPPEGTEPAETEDEPEDERAALTPALYPADCPSSYPAEWPSS